MPLKRRLRQGAGALALWACAGCATVPPAAYPYGGYVPPQYREQPDQAYPLIVFLHGAGDTNPQEKLIPQYAAGQPDFPFIVMVPRAARDWEVDRLDALLDKVRATYRIDPARIYLTGISMGAFGAWKMAVAHPDTFAAVVLIAGGGDPTRACALKQVPVWLIHNRNDQVVPARGSKLLAEALEACGGTVRLTMDDKPASSGWTHDAWSGVYSSAPLYDWFLSHRR
jgi:predicted peptidase